jgi:hypothetical protein
MKGEHGHVVADLIGGLGGLGNQIGKASTVAMYMGETAGNFEEKITDESIIKVLEQMHINEVKRKEMQKQKV